LGKDFLVTSSYGHIRDLEKKNKGVEIENDFKPLYKISEEKKKVVTELKKLAKKQKLFGLQLMRTVRVKQYHGILKKLWNLKKIK